MQRGLIYNRKIKKKNPYEILKVKILKFKNDYLKF